MSVAVRSWPLPIRGLLVVAAGALIGFVAVQPLGQNLSPVPGTGAGDRSEGFVPLSGATSTGLSAETAAPDLVGTGEPALTDLAGRPVELADLAGRPVWIVFWATWCPPCKHEMPALSAAAETYADAGLVMLAISVEEPTGEVEAFVGELDLRMRVLTDPRGRSMRQWAVFGLPTHYLVAPDGSIAWRWFGPLDPEEIDRRAREAVDAGTRSADLRSGDERDGGSPP